jgi:hypothetical protein
MSNAPTPTRAPDGPAGETTPAAAIGDERFPQIESILSPPEVKQTFGLVEAREGSVFLVRSGADVVHARRAKGCLVEPETGDMVLVARSEHHGSFVLSVLAGRTEDGESLIAVDGNLTLRSNNGRVAIVAGESVNVTSGGEVAVNAPSVVARTMKATIFSDTLSYVGRKIEAQVERVKLVGQALDTVIDRVSSRVKHSHRTIEEIERVKAKEVHLAAEGTLHMHGKNTLMTAEKLVKFDGEQIHIG